MVLLQFALTFPSRAFQKVTLKEKLKLIFSLRLGLGREGLTITYKHLGFVSYYILNIATQSIIFQLYHFFFQPYHLDDPLRGDCKLVKVNKDIKNM